MNDVWNVGDVVSSLPLHVARCESLSDEVTTLPGSEQQTVPQHAPIMC